MAPDPLSFVVHKLRAANHLRREAGNVAVARRLVEKIIRPDGIPPSLFSRDVLGFYDFVLPKPFGPAPDAAQIEPRTINWVIPEFGVGSGGHINIFRFVANLEEAGWECRIVVVGNTPHNTAELKKIINEHFNPVRAQVTIGARSLRPAWVTMATSWPTAYVVRDFRSTIHKCYFVQDFEPYFYSHGSEYYFAEDSYRFGFLGITFGTWLADKLAKSYGMRTAPLSFSYDKALYQPLPRRDPATKHVFFYSRPPTPRRAFEIGLMALNQVAAQLPDVRFILAGWDVSEYAIPFTHLNAGLLSLAELPDLYSQCEVALVISSTNLSLLPLELMACGCPVVSNTGANVEWLLTSENTKLCEPRIEALAAGILDVLENGDERQRLSECGLRLARSTSWEHEGEQLGRILGELDGADPHQRRAGM